MNVTAKSGEARFQDIKIKKAGVHNLKVRLQGFDILPYDNYPDTFMQTQRMILGALLLIESERFFTETRFNVQSGAPFYLMNDYEPLLKYLTSNTTRAGIPFDPAPVCMVTDFYGNLAPESNFRVGLTIRDSDQDEFDPDSAFQTFGQDPMQTNEDGSYVGWPPNSLNPHPIGSYVDVKFTKSEFEIESTIDDIDGCKPFGEPAGGCTPLSDDVADLIQRDRTVNSNWCPNSAERRYCRTCLTAERFFTSFNQTFWKQEYEYGDSTLPGGLTHFRGAFDCPSRKHCRDDGGGCGCLIPLHNASERSIDLCSSCSTRAMNDGMPIAWSIGGRAMFPKVKCSTPRKGYRLLCVAPPGYQGYPELGNQPRLHHHELS